MPTWVHEWVVAPLAVMFAFRYTARALGRGRALVELLTLAAYGFALEWVAMRVFSAYRYGAEWTLAPLGVPLAVAAVWAAVITMAMAAAGRASLRTPGARAAFAAAVAIALDLLIEPVASRLQLWEWTPPGPWLAVPVGNFVGWAVVVGGFSWGAERWAGTGPLGRELARRLLVAGGSIVGLVAVGWTWRLVGAEATFQGGQGWFAWAVLLLLPALLSLRTGALPGRAEETLVTRLGRTPGRAPWIVFAGVALVFSVDAVLIGDTALVVVATGTLLCLSFALRAYYLNSFFKLVRAESLGERASSS